MFLIGVEASGSVSDDAPEEAGERVAAAGGEVQLEEEATPSVNAINFFFFVTEASDK
jgi:hypothetical protein